MTAKEEAFKRELAALDRFTHGEPIVGCQPSLTAWASWLRELARRCMAASYLAEEAALEQRQGGVREPARGHVGVGVED